MHEKSKEFKNNNQSNVTREIPKQNNDSTLDLELYQKIYLNNERNFKFSDDEFQAFNKKISNNDSPKNHMATTLNVIGVLIIIGGLITGLVLGSDGNDLNFITAFVTWIGSLISGILVLALAEIIGLLTEIKNK